MIDSLDVSVVVGKSRTVERLYTKPRGYAGDFRTTDYMIRNEPSGTEDSGLIFDRKFLDLPPVAAIRNRSGLITEEIIQTPGAFKFAALCSGTCDEIFAACEGSRRRTDLNATAIDFDAGQQHQTQHRDGVDRDQYQQRQAHPPQDEKDDAVARAPLHGPASAA